MNTQFLQRQDGKFDRVDQIVYGRWDQAIDRDGNLLYNGVGFEYTPSGPKFLGCPTWASFALILRIMDVRPVEGAVVGGIFKEPEFVRLRPKGRGKIQVHEIQHEAIIQS